MRKWLLVSIATMMAGLFFSAGGAAQDRTAPAPSRDLSGIWGLKEAASPPWALGTDKTFAFPIPLQPWAKEHCQKVGCGRGIHIVDFPDAPGQRYARRKGGPRGSVYLEGEDPYLARCAPMGFPRMLISGGLIEIFQIPNRVFMSFQIPNDLRTIWMDGRGHPDYEADPAFRPSWKGHSIGRWDGDTLVVDTTGFLGGDGGILGEDRGKYKWLDPAGHPHSDKLHVVERIRRTNPNTLQFDLRFEDPETFTAPLTGKVIYELRPKGYMDSGQLQEYYMCEDRIFAEKESETWPFITGEYPPPHLPPAGPDDYYK